jgi:hypothetical protein
VAYSYLDDVRASSTLEDASTGSKVIKWLTGLVLIGHGLIHGLGPIAIWGIADVEGFGGNAALAVSDTALQLLAVGWLVAMVILVVVGFGLIAGKTWWRDWALAGAIVSQLVIAIWWTDAAAGTIPNILIAAAAIWGDRLYPPTNSEYL